MFDLYKGRADDDEISDFYLSKKIKRFSPKIKFLGVFDTVGSLGIPIKRINDIATNFDLIDYEFHDVTLANIVEYAYHALAIDEQRVPFTPALWKEKPADTKEMEQRWFAGVHSNIGGGYNPDDFANVALKYIVEKSKARGLEFDDRYLGFFGSDILREVRDSMSFKYRLLGRLNREIVLGDASNQVVDDSVYDKIAGDDSYKPSNVPPR